MAASANLRRMGYDADREGATVWWMPMFSSSWLALFQGIGIGLAVAAPVGPVGVLCIKRTLDRGASIGLATGLGAAVADGLYGGVAAFGLWATTNALIASSFWFRLAGGLFLLWLAGRLLMHALRSDRTEIAVAGNESSLDIGVAFGSTILLTLSNPATILTFAGIFAGTSLGALEQRTGAAATLTAGVFTGSALWWLFLVGITSRFRHRLTSRMKRVIDLLSGLAFLVFALVVLWGVWN